ncbi:14049_t:CDS:2 [Cetraspora pellucida]|uniref:14049_t:CDS:1 n=1 Tax=Cetraspora pellucida TaxID=1433469 RepID=A0A9N9FAK6_9GLOM|nr:14049_t:CDS:2 [Cetraspora pellucida]
MQLGMESGEPLQDYSHEQSIYKLFKSKKPYCTPAYVVSYRGALKLFKKRFSDLIAPTDLELTNMITENKITSYTIIPPVISRCYIFNDSTDLYPGKNILDSYLPLKELELKTASLNSAQVACYNNHYKIYQSIIQYGYDSALILEDDDIFFLGYCSDAEARGDLLDDQNNSSLHEVHKSVISFCTHDYAVSQTNNTLGFNKIYFIKYQNEPDYQNIVETLTKMSDKLCYESIINYGYGSVLILEDDIDIEIRITSIMVDIHRILPADWDIVLTRESVA